MGITLRAVQSLGPGEPIWDAGHREAVRGFGRSPPAWCPGLCRQIPCIASVSLQLARTDRLGRLRRPAKRRNACLALWLMAKTPADERALAALQAADTFRKIADQYLKRAKQKQRPRTHSETERFLLVTWKPLHPVPVV